ncbi:MAG: single-stranded-DNA-specific exonuclease RecJ [Clostridiales bacterium]|nr:single-stranded-DNA-specific exonuclease RecJ [Clostridiales bacterium]
MIRLIPRHQAAADPLVVREIASALALSPVMAELLVGRGLDTVAKADAFLRPDASGLHDPFALGGMDEAVRRIREAVSDGRHIVLYGDYDVDGVSGTALLLMAMRTLGARVHYYIPSRHAEGYGLNEEAIARLAGEGASLLITVDCGVSNCREAALARSLGMEVIVTDHHECPSTLPECAALINPHLPGTAYPFADLCGAGVAFKLVEALIGRERALEYVDLAALATVADIVPLVGENRILTSLGLDAINRSPRPGVRALIAVSGLEEGDVGAGHLGFQLGPRINAGGRMDLARKAVELLTTDDCDTAVALAAELDRDNNERRSQCARMEREACEMASREVDFLSDRAVVLWRDDWNSGILGIVAGKLTERYWRPVVLLAREAERYHGSARSIPGVHLYHVLEECAHLFERFGGHAQAAGMAIAGDRLEEFRKRLNALLRQVPSEVFTPVAYYDRALRTGEADERLLSDLDRLRPTGYGNARPVFLIEGVRLGEPRTMGSQGQHYRACARQDGQALPIVAFGQKPPLLRGAKHDALVSLERNSWQGRVSLQANLLALQSYAVAREVDKLISRCDDAFDLSLWQQLDQADAAAHDPLPASGTREYCERLMASDPFYGTLILLPEPSAARDAVRVLEEYGLLERFDVRCGTAVEAMPADNCLLLAPDFSALCPRFWAEICVWGGVVREDFVVNRLSQLSPARIGIIMEPGYVQNALARLVRYGFSDTLLRAMYAAVRRELTGGRTFRETDGPARWLAGELGMPISAAAAGLRILSELSLISCSEEPPYIVFHGSRGKVSLHQSATYRRILQTLYPN